MLSSFSFILINTLIPTLSQVCSVSVMHNSSLESADSTFSLSLFFCSWSTFCLPYIYESKEWVKGEVIGLACSGDHYIYLVQAIACRIICLTTLPHLTLFWHGTFRQSPKSLKHISPKQNEIQFSFCVLNWVSYLLMCWYGAFMPQELLSFYMCSFTFVTINMVRVAKAWCLLCLDNTFNDVTKLKSFLRSCYNPTMYMVLFREKPAKKGWNADRAVL